jgi:putative N6-adenine-specific DNA methylase
MAKFVAQSWTLFAACTPGLESILAHELRGLTDAVLTPVEGGVELPGDFLDAAGLCLWSRSPSGILVRLGKFKAKSLQQLYDEAKKLNWSPVVQPGQEVVVRATVKGSRIQRAENAARKLELAIHDALRGSRKSYGQRSRTPVTIILRIRGGDVTISADAVGQPLHRRGYRKATAKAPLRENLAAAMLIGAGWDPDEEALADPMCGAGTFSIEAALLAQDLPPGRRLRPAVVEWPGFPRKGWAQLQQQIQGVATRLEHSIFSSDRDQGAIRAASSNADRAGVAKLLQFRNCSLSESWEDLPETGLVVVNPPYGQRIGEKGKIHGLYSHFGKALRNRYPGWRIAVVCPDKSLAGRLAPGIEEITRFKNGGLPVGLYLGELPKVSEN